MSVRLINKSWWVDFRLNKKRYRKRSPMQTMAGAKKFESILRCKLMQGESIDDENEVDRQQTYKTFAWKWFDGYVKLNNKFSEIRSKKSILNKHLIPFFGKSPLDQISTYQIEQFKKLKLENAKCKKLYSKKTVDNLLMVLSKSLRTAQEWYGIDKLPKIKLFKEPAKEFDYLNADESAHLLKHAEGMWHDMILLGVRTGMRLGELIGLEWGSVDFKTNQIVVRHSIVRNVKGTPKSNKTRFIPMAPDLAETLMKKRQPSGYVFTYRGKFLRTDYCNTSLTRICKLAEMRRITWHKLRHSFASQLVSAGASLTAVQQLLGHSDMKTTMIYAHLAPSALQGTVDLLSPEESCGQPVGNGLNFGKLENSGMSIIVPKVKQKQSINSVS